MTKDRPSPRPASSPPPSATSDAGDGPSGIELAPENLSPEALHGLIEEFVSREGTDYGHVDRSLESKVADVRRQLDRGEARIVFDLESETASIVSTRELARRADRPERGGRADGEPDEAD